MLAAIITLVGVFLTARGALAGWIAGIAGAALYVYIFYSSQLFAESVLQVFYVILGFFGFLKWLGGKAPDSSGPVIHLPKPAALFSLACIILGTALCGFMLSLYSSTDVPYADAGLAVAGLVITWQMARRYLQNWVWWVVVDLLSAALFAYKQLYITSILYVCLAIIALSGYFRWKTLMLQPVR